MEGHNDYVVFDAVGATDHRSEHQQQHVADVHQHEIHALKRVDRAVVEEEDETSKRQDVEDHVAGERTALQLKIALGSHSADAGNQHQTRHSGSASEGRKRAIPNNGANTQVNVISTLDCGNNTDDDFGSGSAESQERSASDILLQVQLDAEDFETWDEVLIANLRIIREALRHDSDHSKR